MQVVVVVLVSSGRSGGRRRKAGLNRRGFKGPLLVYSLGFQGQKGVGCGCLGKMDEIGQDPYRPLQNLCRIASLYSATILACLQPGPVEGKSEHTQTEIIHSCAEDNDQRYLPQTIRHIFSQPQPRTSNCALRRCCHQRRPTGGLSSAVGGGQFGL